MGRGPPDHFFFLKKMFYFLKRIVFYIGSVFNFVITADSLLFYSLDVKVLSFDL